MLSSSPSLSLVLYIRLENLDVLRVIETDDNNHSLYVLPLNMKCLLDLTSCMTCYYDIEDLATVYETWVSYCCIFVCIA